MDQARAGNPADYTLTQSLRHGRKLVTQPVAFGATYDATAHSVTLTLTGNPGFAKGGRLTVVAQPPAGLIDAAGVALDGSNQGKPGDDATFIIAPKGSAISR
jgi:hypothetical protein